MAEARGRADWGRTAFNPYESKRSAGRGMTVTGRNIRVLKEVFVDQKGK